jgi:Delta7-sterol 5-desaturase
VKTLSLDHLPVFSFSVTFLLVGLVMLLRYLALSGGFFWLGLHRQRLEGEGILLPPGKSAKSSIPGDVCWSLLSSACFALVGTGLIFSLRYEWIKLLDGFSWSMLLWVPLNLILLLVLHDAFFYWSHRWMHWPKFLRSFHWVHHESRRPTAWTAFAFHPYEAFIQAMFLPMALWLIPTHWVALLLFLMTMSLFGVTNHLGQEIFPAHFLKSKLGRQLITATHHQRHHHRPAHNFGLYFVWWDHLMQTEDWSHHEQ